VNLPKGAAYRLPAGSHIVAEIHYQGAKGRVVEHGTLGLYLADQPTPDIVTNVILDAKGTGPKLRASVKLPADTYALALRPEIQPGMQSIEVSARRPDGGTKILLFAKDFHLDWPTPYILKDPVGLPKGSDLWITATYAAPPPPNSQARVTLSRIQKPIVP
jgi:hypothetical protein